MIPSLSLRVLTRWGQYHLRKRMGSTRFLSPPAYAGGTDLIFWNRDPTLLV